MSSVVKSYRFLVASEVGWHNKETQILSIGEKIMLYLLITPKLCPGCQKKQQPLNPLWSLYLVVVVTTGLGVVCLFVFLLKISAKIYI